MLLSSSLLVVLIHVVAGCDPPYQTVEGGCYFYPRDLYVGSWEKANDICRDLGGHMTVVKSGEENRAIIDNLLTPNAEFRNVLLGATTNDIGLLEWVDGTLVRDSFTSWGDGEPNGSGDCMGYSTNHDLFWNDIHCDNYTDRGWFVGILCEQSPGQNLTTTQGPTTTPTTMTTPTTTPFGCPDGFTDMGTGCYNVSKEEMSFVTASAYCATFGSHLVYITSAEEQGAIEEYIFNNSIIDRVWIGADDRFGNDTFYWLDGSAVDDGYTNWADGQPDGGTAYLYLHEVWDWQWADIPVGRNYYPLCEIDM